MIRPITVTDGETTFDLLDYRLTKSVQETCLHANERIIGAKSGYPADTCTLEFYCPDCLRYRYEELTDAQMEAAENEAKGERNVKA